MQSGTIVLFAQVKYLAQALDRKPPKASLPMARGADTFYCFTFISTWVI
jgi:hypothetical protein